MTKNDSDLRNRSEQQMIDYGVRMRERAERAEAKLHSIERFATGLAVAYNPRDVRRAGRWILDRLKEDES